jgi:hypothetical protein
MAYLSTTTPEYPIITWQVTIPDISITVRIGIISDTITIPAGDYWGYAENTAGVALNTSLMGILADRVQECLRGGGDIGNFSGLSSIVIAGSYEWRLAGDVRYLAGKLQFLVDTPSSNIQVTIPTNNSDFGSDGTAPDFSISTITTVGYSDFNLAGYWAPYNQTVYDERRSERQTFQTEAAYQNNIQTISWGPSKTRRLLQFPFVYAAYVYQYRRALSVFSEAAQTDTDDPNNLLDNLFEAAGDGLQMRIYQDEGEYRLGTVVGPDMNDLQTWLDDISGRGALWSVDILFVDQGSVGGAI